MQELHHFTIRNSRGMETGIINFGAAVISIKVPDKNDIQQEVTLGFDTPEEYVLRRTHMGAMAGRIANRIARGMFVLDGKTYQLACNNGRNHLHGGPSGWGKLFWEVEGTSENAVRLTLHSVDGDEGYPGNVDVSVTYKVEETNTLSIEITALTDAPTPINPTSHCYFNLHGDHHRNILDHDLWINADYYTPSDSELIPTGEIALVEGTPMDFRKLKQVGVDIRADFTQLQNANGYDHNWVLNDFNGQVRKVATLYSMTSGITLDTFTNQPGLQCYTGNALANVPGRNRMRYENYAGICLETQGFPDAVNHENFPTIILKPGEEYVHLTKYAFHD